MLNIWGRLSFLVFAMNYATMFSLLFLFLPPRASEQGNVIGSVRIYIYTSLKSTGTRDELSITLYLQSEINFCSVRMPVNA